MVKVYTSYFAQVNKLRSAGIVPIGISVFPPKFFNGPSLQWLAPLPSMLKGMSEEEYTFHYKEKILSKFNLDLFRQRLKELGDGKDVALCCFEKPGEFCHRRIFAEWFEELTGYKIEEYGQEEKVKKPEFVQNSLF